MNLKEQILKEHSKANSLRIVAWVGSNPARFKELLHLFLHDEYRVVQRAAWAISTIAETHPDLIAPHLGAMINRMEDRGLPSAVSRNVLRILQTAPLPEELHGPLMNSCFRLLEDPKEPIAIRVFAMTVLGRLAKVYPELKVELRAIITNALEQEPSAGFKSRSAKVLKMIA
jgi:hypothetical protein